MMQNKYCQWLLMLGMLGSLCITHPNAEELSRRHKMWAKSHLPTSLMKPLSEQMFNFTYSGDVAHVLELLRQYDSRLIILSPLGKKKFININLDL